MFRLRNLFEVIESDDRALPWLREQGLIINVPQCPVCGEMMHFRVREGAKEYRCRKRGETPHDKSVSVFKNSFFGQHKWPYRKVLILTYLFSHNITNYDFLIHETSLDGVKTSSETIADWLSYCREVCELWAENHNREMIGGEGKIVEIDETKIGRRKYNRGRLIEGCWILGMIEREGVKNFRLEICPNNKRDAATLLPIIMKFVRPGTTIITDEWKSYHRLMQLSFNHQTVNHSLNFVDPMTLAHTQNIESVWRSVKRTIHCGGNKRSNLHSHLCEYLWRRYIRSNSDVDVFLEFLKIVKEVYNPSEG